MARKKNALHPQPAAMSERPRLTALLPLKNYHPDFLRKSVASIFNQSCPRWDLLIIVEKNQFKTFNALLQTELQHPQVTLIVNEGRRLGGALNTGMRQAKTDFVAILLADDMWASNAVEVLTEAIAQSPEVDFFHSSRRIVDEKDEPLSSVHYSRETFSLADFEHSSPVKHLLCWRREKALSLGGIDESLDHGPDDYDFPWTMAQAGAVFQAIKEPLYIYRDHREAYRLTTHIPLSSQKRAIRKIMRKHGASPASIKAKVAAAEGSYLQQCLFKSRADQRHKEKLGYNPRGGWRENFR